MTKNDYTTLVSIRLENDTLKAIKQFLVKHYYLKKSAVINQALKKVFAWNNEKDVYDFLYNGKGLESCDTKN